MKRLLLYGAAAILVSIVPQVSPATSFPSIARQVATARPNFIVVITDDEIIHTMQKMPHVLALAARGVSFDRALVSNSLCCPSRSTILTGLTSGHTGVWGNAGSWGGWRAFTRNGVTSDGAPFDGTGDNGGRTVALYLQHDGGYLTGLFGKYLNGYGADDATVAPPIPPGWSSWHSFVGGNGHYYHYRASDDGTIHHHRLRPRDYSTDVFGKSALAFLQTPSIQDGSTPFFMYYAPFAPHGPLTPGPLDGGVHAPTSFRNGAFNERDVSDKPVYVRRQPLIGPSTIHALNVRWDHVYGTLRDVDRWLGRFEDALPASVRADTVFVFMSDNGYEWGDHRLNYKIYPYERTIRVPLIIAGPGIVHRRTNDLATNADLTPTILDLAGLSASGGPFDGRSLTGVLSGSNTPVRRRAVIEHLGSNSKQAPSYCGLRTGRWKYVIYQKGFQELYDLNKDPNELVNIAKRRPDVTDRLRSRTRAMCRPAPPNWDPAVWDRADG